MAGLNYLAVLVAAIVNMVVGALWYSPAVAGKRWMELMGFKQEDMQKRMSGAPRAYILTFVASLLMAYALARVIWYADAFTLMAGSMIGLLAWLGFVVTSHAANYLFEGKSFPLFTLNMGYHLIGLVLMGALLGAWR